MKTVKSIFKKTGLLLGLCMLMTNAYASDSLNHVSNGIVHSTKGVSELAKGGVKVSAAVVAVPLGVIGGLGTGSAQASDALLDFAVGANGELPITDTVMVAGPSPSMAMQTNKTEEGK